MVRPVLQSSIFSEFKGWGSLGILTAIKHEAPLGAFLCLLKYTLNPAF